MSLKVSVSGVRGIWADSLSMDVLYHYTRAFACYVLEKGGRRILLGRDGRPSGESMSRFAASILNMMGLDTVDAGLVPTPTILYGVRNNGFDAGLMLSASHNPLEWNAFKFVKKGGVFTDDDDLIIIKRYLEKPLPQPSWEKIGTHCQDSSVMDTHLNAVLSAVDVPLIQKSKLKVLLDPVNCSGSLITKKLFNALHIDASYVNDTPDGHFSRPAEPIPAHLQHLKDIILEKTCDIAFAQDPDADRLVIADETGWVVSEELTPVLALWALLKRGEKGSIVLNMSTSSAGEKLNQLYQGKSFRSKVGEANVVKKIEATQSFYGIEGNGGIIYPKVNAARDSLMGIALILEFLAKEKKPLSKLIGELPPCVMKKEKYNFEGSLEELFHKMTTEFPEGVPNWEDGLRLDFKDDSWIHLRASNTEPIVRLIAEASDLETVEGLLKRIKIFF